MKTRITIMLSWYILMSLLVVSCLTSTVIPTETPVQIDSSKSSQLPEGCPPECSEAQLQGVDLSGADLSNANLVRAVLDEANLRGANLSGARLTNAWLRNTDLSGANLSNANLEDIALHEAVLTDADLKNAAMNLAHLPGANLEGANLNGANLTAADLWSNASLRNAKLRGAILINADLRLADLRGTDFSEADLSGAALEESMYNDDTIWPNNFDPEEAGSIIEGGIQTKTPFPSSATPTLIPVSPISYSYSPGAIGDYVISEVTINEPDRYVSFSNIYTLDEVEDNRYRITVEAVDGTPPENYRDTSENWINLSDLPSAYDSRSIGETWIEPNILGIGQEVSVHRLENEIIEIGDSSFEAVVVEITPMDQSSNWKRILHLAYDVPVTPIIGDLLISWEIGPRGGKVYSNYSQNIIEIGRTSR